ncbi:hypothetical protein H0H93_013734 [Arthromyces matolae]|nr:hypothetical protein H0H93_013734 [Arthromyces matolae]
MLLAFLQLGFGIASMAEAYITVFFEKFVTVEWVPLTWLTSAAVCDIVIAAVQVTWLLRHRGRVARLVTLHSTNISILQSLNSSNRIVNTLVAYILSTGLLTRSAHVDESVLAITEFSTFAALGFNFVHIFNSFCLGSVYTVSFLANLTARQHLRDARPEFIDMSGQLSKLRSFPGKSEQSYPSSAQSNTTTGDTAKLDLTGAYRV